MGMMLLAKERRKTDSIHYDKQKIDRRTCTGGAEPITPARAYCTEAQASTETTAERQTDAGAHLQGNRRQAYIRCDTCNQ